MRSMRWHRSHRLSRVRQRGAVRRLLWHWRSADQGATDTETSGDGPKVGECVGVYELVRIVRLEVKTEITEHPAK